jgi:chitinase
MGMNLLRCGVLVYILGFAATIAALGSDQRADQKRVVGYFAEWTKYSADQIPADLLTHINYAFAVIKDGECSINNGDAANEKMAQLRAFKQKHPQVQTLISVGGWTDSGSFSDAALTDASREKFARSCAAFARAHGFDGVDIDWEYPTGGGLEKDKGRPEDTKNFTLLLAELRKQLDAQGKADKKHYLLTIAAPASRAQSSHIELNQIIRSLDWINLMTYDFAGSWSEKTGFNAPLFGDNGSPSGSPGGSLSGSVDASAHLYLASGVPAEKLVLGVPFYGRAWAGVKNIDHGLSQPHTAKPPRGEWTYDLLVSQYIDHSAKRYWSEEAKVPWLYDEKAGLMITYEDPESIRLKAKYARDHRLGGVMIWELSHDDEKSSLLHALNQGMQAP